MSTPPALSVVAAASAAAFGASLTGRTEILKLGSAASPVALLGPASPSWSEMATVTFEDPSASLAGA